MLVRAYRTGDDAKVAELLGPETGRDGRRVIVAEEGDAVVGAAVWQGERGGVAQLGDVTPALADRRDVFYELVRGCAAAALEQGFTHATFTLRDPQLLQRIQRDFRTDRKVTGREPSKDGNGTARVWEITVDLADAIEQLDGALNKLGAR